MFRKHKLAELSVRNLSQIHAGVMDECRKEVALKLSRYLERKRSQVEVKLVELVLEGNWSGGFKLGVKRKGMTEKPADKMIEWEVVRALEMFYSEVYE